MSDEIINPTTGVPEGQPLAVLAEGLYLGHLLMFPLLGFIALLGIYFSRYKSAPNLARCHLKQTIVACLWQSTIVLIFLSVSIAKYGFATSEFWMGLMIYFEVVHLPFMLLGVIGLIKAMQGKLFKYPLIGPRCDE